MKYLENFKNLNKKLQIRILFENIRFNSTQDIPVIKIPKYLEKNLGNSIYHEHKKNKQYEEKRNLKLKNSLLSQHMNKKIISWTGDKNLFHYYGTRYNRNNVPLISKFLLKETYNNEYMTIHNFDGNPSVMSNAIKEEERSFQHLGLNESLVESIYNLVNNGKPVNPSTIQFAAIPLILSYKNIIFSAETGSGKTIAYLAPLIQMIQEKKKTEKRKRRHPYGLIVTPSRELTEQIGNVAKILCSNTDVGVATMIGGLSKKISHTGFDLIISTIGIIESHLNNNVYSLRNLSYLVLDEIDTLLDDSFVFETMELLGNMNINSTQSESEYEDEDPPEEEPYLINGTQLICSSATIPNKLDATIGSILNLNEDIIQVSTKSLNNLHPNIKHIFYRVNRHKKDIKLIELLLQSRSKKLPVMIFGNRTNCVEWLFAFLNENGFPCVRLTSNMSETERVNSFRIFQEGEYDILVATDLGSRGLDTTRVRHVINFDCPHFVADYIHRSGRTGRLGTSFVGRVSTFVSYKLDAYMLMELEKAIRLGEQIPSVNANIKSQLRQKRADKYQKIQRNIQ